MEYFNAAENFTAKRPFAYPAYDDLWTGSGPDEVDDGDLLAPGMLSAPIDVAGLYGLQRIRPRLKAALEGTPETGHSYLARRGWQFAGSDEILLRRAR